MEKIFGIDLGTTNSEIAYMENGKPKVITVQNGKKYIPSAVGIDPQGKIIVGFPARNQYAAYPENTVLSIKRKMGSGEKVRMGGKQYTPAQISSEILKELKRAAEAETGFAVKKAVITVPAYFTDIQRKDTIEAGELAGLEVVRIINEPTAAALAYECRHEKREKILVYDLGGGTFDISYIDVEDDVVEVIATDGDTRLGGDDFDSALVDLFLSELGIEKPAGADLKLRARLKNSAEACKIILSTESHVDVREEFLAGTADKPLHLDMVMARRDFEDLIGELLDRTFSLIDKVLKTANAGAGDVSKVLLVGGSTFIPKIFDVLANDLGFEVHREIDPVYCVAIGAAIQGAIIAGEDIGTILVDVNAHSLGVRCLHTSITGTVDDDFYGVMIHRNTPIPAAMTRTYYTSYENQKEVLVDVYQGEEPAASKNTFLGSFVLDNLPKRLRFNSEIDVTFEYNLNGLVEINALEPVSGRREKMKVDVNKITVVEDAPAPEDLPTDKNTQAYGKMERIIKTAERKLKTMEDDILREKIRSTAGELKDAMRDDKDSAGDLFDELVRLLSEV